MLGPAISGVLAAAYFQVPTSGTRFQRLVEMANRALYLAKRNGRNCVCTFDASAETWGPGMAARKLRARIEAYKFER